MKCQSLFSGKNITSIHLSSVEFAQRVVKVNFCFFIKTEANQ